MNMRTYTNITYEKNRDIIQLMHILSNPSTSIEIYRNTFYKLGKALGALLDEKKHSRYGNTMLACASEDADWLAQGVLSSISQKNVALAVFWNQRITLDETTKLEYSPIVKSNFGSQAEVKERNKAGTADRQTRTEGTQECVSGATRSSTSSSDMNCQEAAPLQVTLQKCTLNTGVWTERPGAMG